MKLTDCGDGGDDLAKLQLVQDGCFTCGIETNLQQGHSMSIYWSGECSGHTINMPVEMETSVIWSEKTRSMKEHTHFFLAEEARKKLGY